MGLSVYLEDHHHSRNLPSVMNTQVDLQSRQDKDPSEWKMNAHVFLKICQIFGKPEIYLFASRLSHRAPQYTAWMPDLFSQGTDAMQQIWSKKLLFVFPLFV